MTPASLAIIEAGRAGRDHLRDHRRARRGRHLTAVRRCGAGRRGVLGRLRHERTARAPSHAPAVDLRSGAVPRGQYRHVRHQRRARRLRVRFHPRPGDRRGYSPVVAGSALVPVTAVTLLLSGSSGRLAQRVGPRPQISAAALAAAFITRSGRPARAGPALIQTPVPHLACPVVFGRAQGQASRRIAFSFARGPPRPRSRRAGRCSRER